MYRLQHLMHTSVEWFQVVNPLGLAISLSLVTKVQYLIIMTLTMPFKII